MTKFFQGSICLRSRRQKCILSGALALCFLATAVCGGSTEDIQTLTKKIEKKREQVTGFKIWLETPEYRSMWSCLRPDYEKAKQELKDLELQLEKAQPDQHTEWDQPESLSAADGQLPAQPQNAEFVDEKTDEPSDSEDRAYAQIVAAAHRFDERTRQEAADAQLAYQLHQATEKERIERQAAIEVVEIMRREEEAERLDDVQHTKQLAAGRGISEDVLLRADHRAERSAATKRFGDKPLAVMMEAERPAVEKKNIPRSTNEFHPLSEDLITFFVENSKTGNLSLTTKNTLTFLKEAVDGNYGVAGKYDIVKFKGFATNSPSGDTVEEWRSYMTGSCTHCDGTGRWDRMKMRWDRMKMVGDKQPRQCGHCKGTGAGSTDAPKEVDLASSESDDKIILDMITPEVATCLHAMCTKYKTEYCSGKRRLTENDIPCSYLLTGAQDIARRLLRAQTEDLEALL